MKRGNGQFERANVKLSEKGTLRAAAGVAGLKRILAPIQSRGGSIIRQSGEIVECSFSQRCHSAIGLQTHPANEIQVNFISEMNVSRIHSTEIGRDELIGRLRTLHEKLALQLTSSQSPGPIDSTRLMSPIRKILALSLACPL